MTVCRLITISALLAILAEGCASSNDPAAVAERDKQQEELARFMAEAQQRWDERAAEEEKQRTQHEMICLDDAPVRRISLFYNVYKQRPNLRLPALEHDFLRNVVENLKLFEHDARARATLTGPVNDELNSRLVKIREGTYNTIHIAFGNRFIGITPLMHPVTAAEVTVMPEQERQTLAMVWFPEAAGRAAARAVVEGRSVDRLVVVDRTGGVVLSRDEPIGTHPLAIAASLLLARAGISTSSRFEDHVAFPPQPYQAIGKTGFALPKSPCTSRVSGAVKPVE